MNEKAPLFQSCCRRAVGYVPSGAAPNFTILSNFQVLWGERGHLNEGNVAAGCSLELARYGVKIYEQPVLAIWLTPSFVCLEAECGMLTFQAFFGFALAGI